MDDSSSAELDDFVGRLFLATPMGWGRGTNHFLRPWTGKLPTTWPCLALALVFAGASASASFDGLASGDGLRAVRLRLVAVCRSRASLARLTAHLHSKGLPCVLV